MPGGNGEDDEQSQFAAELIAMRKQRGWTQEELAARMLVSTSTIGNIESGYRAPTAQRLATLGALRAGTMPEQAAAMFSMMTSPASWRQLTHRAGWTFDQAEAWLTPSLAQLLLEQNR